MPTEPWLQFELERLEKGEVEKQEKRAGKRKRTRPVREGEKANGIEVIEYEEGAMDMGEVSASSTSGSFSSSSSGVLVGSRSRSSNSISGSSNSSSSIISNSTSSGSMSTTSSSRKKGRKSEAEKLLDSLSTGDPIKKVDRGSVRDRRTASGRSSIGPSRQSFDSEGRSTHMLQHSTGVNH